MIPDLTDRQREVFEILRDGANTGRMPTVRELMTKLGISSPNGVMCHLRALARKGLIKRDSNKARTTCNKRSPSIGHSGNKDS